MQGRQGPGYDPWDRSSGKLLAATNGNDSGKQRAMPQRPPGMARVEHPPQTTRVARPRRQSKPPKSWWRRLTLTLQKDPDGNWDITSYGSDLGPTTPTCK